MKRKRIAEDELRSAVMRDSQMKENWGEAWDQVAKAEAAYGRIFPLHSSLAARRAAFHGDLPRIAQMIVTVVLRSTVTFPALRR